jgi:hypothetical protein
MVDFKLLGRNENDLKIEIKKQKSSVYDCSKFDVELHNMH